MDVEIIELAKANVREAMDKEIQRNQQLIENRVIYRNTARQKKSVFIAMASNHVLRHFLNLDTSQQTPYSLNINYPMSEEYKYLMYKTGATKYAPSIKLNAENQLFRDYTHADYKKSRFFLDEALPEQPKASKFWRKFWKNFCYVGGIVLSWCLFGLYFGWIPVAIWGNWNSSPSGSPSHYTTTTNNGSTFGTGGVAAGTRLKK